MATTTASSSTTSSCPHLALRSKVINTAIAPGDRPIKRSRGGSQIPQSTARIRKLALVNYKRLLKESLIGREGGGAVEEDDDDDVRMRTPPVKRPQGRFTRCGAMMMMMMMMMMMICNVLQT